MAITGRRAIWGIPAGTWRGREERRRRPGGAATARGSASANAAECSARFQASDTRVSACVAVHRPVPPPGPRVPGSRRPPRAPHCQFGNQPAVLRVISSPSGSPRSLLRHPGPHGRRASSSRPGPFPRSSGHSGRITGARSLQITLFAMPFHPITSKTFQTPHAASTDRVARDHVII